jgi:hypothetical protein
MFSEAKVIFERKLGTTYGTYSIVDHSDFIRFLKKDEELKKIDWNPLKELPFELEDMIDEWIEQDAIYKDFLH